MSTRHHVNHPKPTTGGGPRMPAEARADLAAGPRPGFAGALPRAQVFDNGQEGRLTATRTLEDGQ